MVTRDDQPSFLPQNCPVGVGATNIEAMVRRKAATSSTAAVTVYRDKQSLLDSGGEDDDVASPPPRKKTRLSTVTAAVSKTRRAALTEKATNPSSSDNSFLRPIEHHESFHEKPQKVKKKALPDSETITNSGKYWLASPGGTRLIPMRPSSNKSSVFSAGGIHCWESGASGTEGTATGQGSRGYSLTYAERCCPRGCRSDS